MIWNSQLKCKLIFPSILLAFQAWNPDCLSDCLDRHEKWWEWISKAVVVLQIWSWIPRKYRPSRIFQSTVMPEVRMILNHKCEYPGVSWPIQLTHQVLLISSECSDVSIYDTVFVCYVLLLPSRCSITIPTALEYLSISASEFKKICFRQMCKLRQKPRTFISRKF